MRLHRGYSFSKAGDQNRRSKKILMFNFLILKVKYPLCGKNFWKSEGYTAKQIMAKSCDV